jgi:hypothetical protein
MGLGELNPSIMRTFTRADGVRPFIQNIHLSVSFWSSHTNRRAAKFSHRLLNDGSNRKPVSRGGFAMQKLGRASDRECLRLMQAFFRIEEPRQRLGLISLAERFAAAPRSEPGDKPHPILQDNRKPIRRRT